MKNPTFQTGNSFSNQSFELGHSRKVWRRIDEQLPGGFVIKNAADFVGAGLVRSGMAVAYDTTEGAGAKDIKVLTWAALKAAGSEGIDALGIIGFLQEDAVVVENGQATGSVVVKGEIYGYMLGDTAEDAAAISAAVKAMSQKNGLSIRVVD